MINLLNDKENIKPRDMTLMDSRGLYIGLIKFKAALNRFPSAISVVPSIFEKPKHDQKDEADVWDNPSRIFIIFF